MGHTVTSQRINLDIMRSELLDFGKAMRQKDREIYEDMLKRSFQHYGAISYADSFHAWAFLLLSVMLEQEKELRKQGRDAGAQPASRETPAGSDGEEGGP